MRILTLLNLLQNFKKFLLSRKKTTPTRASLENELEHVDICHLHSPPISTMAQVAKAVHILHTEQWSPGIKWHLLTSNLPQLHFRSFIMTFISSKSPCPIIAVGKRLVGYDCDLKVNKVEIRPPSSVLTSTQFPSKQALSRSRFFIERSGFPVVDQTRETCPLIPLLS